MVLNGTVRSVKEKDGTLEVVLGDCTSEEENGGLVGRFRRVLCYLEIVEAETMKVWDGIQSHFLQEKDRVFGEGKARIRRETGRVRLPSVLQAPGGSPGSSTRTDMR